MLTSQPSQGRVPGLPITPESSTSLCNHWLRQRPAGPPSRRVGQFEGPVKCLTELSSPRCTFEICPKVFHNPYHISEDNKM